MNRYQATKRIQRVFPRLEIRQAKIGSLFGVTAWDPFRPEEPSWRTSASSLDAAFDALVTLVEAAGAASFAKTS